VTLEPARREPAADEDSATRCDLRGLRVDEALDTLDASLDRAISSDFRMLVVVHGIGTGALRRAVREHLQASPYVASFENSESGEGGDGATVALLC
jgi:DNA mismatch repair protein MutS2